MAESEIDQEFVGLLRAAMRDYDYGPDLSPLGPLSDWLEERGCDEAARQLRREGFPQIAAMAYLESLGFSSHDSAEIVQGWAVDGRHARYEAMVVRMRDRRRGPRPTGGP